MKINLTTAEINHLLRPVLAHGIGVDASTIDIDVAGERHFDFPEKSAISQIRTNHARLVTAVRGRYPNYDVPASAKIECIKLLRELSRTLPAGQFFDGNDPGLIGLGDAKRAIELPYNVVIEYIDETDNVHGLFNSK